MHYSNAAEKTGALRVGKCFYSKKGIKKKKSLSRPDALSLLSMLQFLRNFPGCAGEERPETRSELQLHVFIYMASAGLSASHAGAAS